MPLTLYNLGFLTRSLLNANKTKTVLFSIKRNSTAITPNIVTLQGNLIERVAEYKYLGLLLDEHLLLFLLYFLLDDF